MIGKVASAGRDFQGVTAYLLDGKRRTARNPSRVAWVEARNLLLDDARLNARVMQATARRSVRCKSPVYHFLVSWRREEAPSNDMMRAVADTTCEDIGLGEHQRVLIAHDDTAHRHVHIVVNRVHPESGKAWNRRQDFVRIEQSLRKQSEALGLPLVRGRTDGPPLVTDMDVAVGMYRLGLATRDDIKKVADDRARRLSQAPAHIRAHHAMRLALQSLNKPSVSRPKRDVDSERGR